jgi:hypothetical protein
VEAVPKEKGLGGDIENIKKGSDEERKVLD